MSFEVFWTMIGAMAGLAFCCFLAAIFYACERGTRPPEWTSYETGPESGQPPESPGRSRLQRGQHV